MLLGDLTIEQMELKEYQAKADMLVVCPSDRLLT